MDIEKYPVIGWTQSKVAGGPVPVLDIPMQTDVDWQRDCLRSRQENPEAYAALGEDVPAVIARIKVWLKEHGEEE